MAGGVPGPEYLGRSRILHSVISGSGFILQYLEFFLVKWADFRYSYQLVAPNFGSATTVRGLSWTNTVINLRKFLTKEKPRRGTAGIGNDDPATVAKFRHQAVYVSKKLLSFSHRE